MSGRKGLTLLIVVGVLGVLTVLATAFVTLAQLERKASQQRLNAAKAYLLARSGLEDALARLRCGQDPATPENAYRGEDWNDDGAVTGLEAVAEMYRRGVADLEDCPVQHALRPSYFRQDAGILDVSGRRAPRRQPVNGRERGSSGALGEGIYSLRVRSEEGLYVNGGDLSSAGEHPGTYDTTLKRILGNLAELLPEGGLDEWGDPDPTWVYFPRDDGERLVTLRPAGGWRSLEEAATVLGWDPAKREVFRPYLAFRAWVDKKVIRPNVDPNWEVLPGVYETYPLVAGPAQTAAAWAEIRVGQRDTPVLVSTENAPVGVGAPWSGKRAFNPHTNSYAPDFERDSQGNLVGRAPVDLNWARNRPAVLKALLEGISAIHLDPHYVTSMFGVSTLPDGSSSLHDRGSLGLFFKVSLTPEQASAVAGAIQGHAGFGDVPAEYPDWDGTPSFDSWDEFSRFVDLRLPFLNQAQRDLIKANANPNSDLNKFNPGETAFKLVDKSDLVASSTEFSLEPPPTLRMDACGRVLDGQGRILAERTLTLEAVLERFRMTTQSEFCAGDLGVLDVVGDEAAFRRPGEAGFIAPSGGVERTSGSRLPAVLAAGGKGLALQSYPEPQWPGSPCPPPAVYDGGLQLATVEGEDDPARNPGLTFLASWDDRYDATFAKGSKTCTLDVQMGSPADSLLGRGPVGPAARLNMLYPDGCYSEADRTPGYEARANLGDGLQGLLQFWYKPSYGPEFGAGPAFGRAPTFLNLCPMATPPAFITDGGTQCFRIGAKRREFGKSLWGALVENRFAGDLHIEQGPWFEPWDPLRGAKAFWFAHRWNLLTFQWNLRGANWVDYGCLAVNATSHRDTYTQYYNTLPVFQPDGGGPNPEANRLTRDTFREDGSIGTPFFYLGLRGCQINAASTAADGTFDEFACLSRTTNMAECMTLAQGTFSSGRYYKEDAGLDPGVPEFVSCPIPLGKGTTVLGARWTLVLPRCFSAPMDVEYPALDLWPNANRVFYGSGEVLSLRDKTAGAIMSFLDGSGSPLAVSRDGGPLAVPLAGGILKIGANLCPRLGDNTGDWEKLKAPILESPVLDDITLTYVPAGGPRILAWGGGK